HWNNKRRNGWIFATGSSKREREVPDLQSDDDFIMPIQPKRKKQLSLSRKSKESEESVSTKKVNPFVSSNEAEGSTNSDFSRPHSKNTSSSSSSPSLERPIARPSIPDHQIYSTSVNQELIKRLNQEKQQIKSIFSNIIDITNNHLMERLNIKCDYHLWVPIVNDATKYINQLIDNSDTRDKYRRKLQLSFIPLEETYSFSKHYEMNWVHCFANKLWAPRNPLLNKNSEGWLNCHILTPLINDFFLTCEEIQVHR
ncbi:20434_t:CDS:2, partial [Funneliformis geosporum]